MLDVANKVKSKMDAASELINGLSGEQVSRLNNNRSLYVMRISFILVISLLVVLKTVDLAC